MTNVICEPIIPTLVHAAAAAELFGAQLQPKAQSELVRGQDSGLLERVGPLVRQRNVALDLSLVERIDAAGISALISLYRNACETGHHFCVTNVPARVARVLELVGLEHILVSHNTVRGSHYEACHGLPAA